MFNRRNIGMLLAGHGQKNTALLFNALDEKVKVLFTKWGKGSFILSGVSRAGSDEKTKRRKNMSVV